MSDQHDDSEAKPLTRREMRENQQAARDRRRLPSVAAHDVAAHEPVPVVEPTPVDEEVARVRGPNGTTGHAGLDDLFVPNAVHDPSPKRRRRGCLVGIVVLLVVLGGIAVGVSYVWNTFGDRISAAMGWDGPDDYEEGQATGEVQFTIASGDTGSSLSTKLFDAGVTLKDQTFYDYLIESGQDPTFFPGTYALQEKMTAAAALTALTDETNRVSSTVLITEGSFAADALVAIADHTGIPLEELTAAAADWTRFGVPPEAPSIEGFLFPATYQFDPGTTADQVIQRLVDEMFSRLDAQGVAPADRLRVLTMAALVQREAGNEADMPKIARVFENRIAQGMLLQSDATVAYGTGDTHTVWTTDDQRADANNPYNTYVHPGLPVGPIGLPGEAAIAAAITPAAGDWLYFVPVNLATGETVFTSTLADHEAAVARLQAWCAESDENMTYCE